MIGWILLGALVLWASRIVQALYIVRRAGRENNESI